MKADAYDLRKVLGIDRQLFAPLFQRPYVWDRERQWEPLWNDIRSIAELLFQGNASIKPHFLGAVVLDQLRVPVGRPDARQIIDGQQRLTTLQVFLAAFRDLCSKNPEFEKLSRATQQLVFNTDPMADKEEDRFKVWPTNVDRAAYRAVMTAGSPEEVRGQLKQGKGAEQSQVAKAYFYFFDAIAEWTTSDTGLAYKKLEALLFTIREKVRIVVIDMDDDDDAQVIFETLNARGTPLLASDLVKNFLFHSAQEAGADVESLYDAYWQPFEKEDGFWRGEIRQGRLKRPRIDLFLQHYLTLMRNNEVFVSLLFTEFQKFWDRHVHYNAEWHMRSLRDHASYFQTFLTMSQQNREGKFFQRLRIMDTTTVFPFLLGLYHDLNDASDMAKERLGILEDIESFLVRRMVCRMTAKDYNRLFLDFLGDLRAKGEFTRRYLREYLMQQTAESRLWPSDEQFRQAWLREPLYKIVTRPRLRMLLEALDEALYTPKSERYHLNANLTVEHILPQDWQEHWPLKELAVVETPESRIARIERRNQLLHTTGNLTLLTKALNPSVSNGPFDRKRKEILKHSALNLNRFLAETGSWDEEEILNRGERLFEVARRIWPHPKDGS
jgi:hypothetical protein